MPLQIYKIASTTVGSAGATNITFSNIPQGYTDLLIVSSLRSDVASIGGGGRVEFNGSAANYSERLLWGDGSAAKSSNRTGNWIDWSSDSTGTSATTSVFSSTEIYIPNYAGNTNKSLSSVSLIENNGTYATIYANAGLWSNTSAITSIKIYLGSGNFIQYSTATLYGVL